MASSPHELDLAIHGRNAWANFNVAYETLEKIDSTVSDQPDAAAIRSEMQRFQLWAINIGLYRQDHGSLDYRLRDNEVVRSFTKELFLNLTEALEEITNIASFDDEVSPSTISAMPDSDALRAENDEPVGTRNDGTCSLSPDLMGTFNDESESMLTLHFEDVREAIDQMFNLASQIRSPKTRKVRTDIDIFKEVDDEIKSEYIKMRKRAELQGIEQILLQSRKPLTESQTDETDLILTHEDEYLIERLQKANHARRQQFECWKRSRKRSIRAATKAIETIPSSKHHDQRQTKVLKYDTPSLVQPSENTRSLLSSVPALPKDFVLRDNKSTYSGTSRGLTDHGPSGEKTDWPKPPVAGPLREDFECPFCFYFCPPRYSKDAAWRSHLTHDLRPYVCTYDECAEPNVLYDSREEWTRHEQWAHQQRIWRCSQHPQHEYVELADYEDHVRTYHAASTHQLLSSELIKSQESVSQLCDRPCPFCLREFEQPIGLQQHIAGHLESIALLALPNLNDIDENSDAGKANSNSANRNHAESKAGDFDRTEPLIFLENDHPEGTPVVTDVEKNLSEGRLNTEGISFESVSRLNLEAPQAYSSELIGGWLSHLSREIVGHDFEGQSEYDFIQPRLAPETPGSPTTSDTFSTHSSNPNSVLINSWLSEVFEQSRPLTLLEENTGRGSTSLASPKSNSSVRLEKKGYVNLFEFAFENGDLLVRLYQRSHDGRSRMSCRTIRSPHPQKDVIVLPLVSLIVSRSGPFLKFYNVEILGGKPELWACLQFHTYEYMALFFCTFLALRFEDDKTPLRKIVDYELDKEDELFAGRIVDDQYEHALRLFQERDTGVLRLQASVTTGDLKRKPIWTAFITHQILCPTWLLRHSRRIVLADLQQYIFTSDYESQKTPTGAFELTFIEISDAKAFVEAIEALVAQVHAFFSIRYETLLQVTSVNSRPFKEITFLKEGSITIVPTTGQKEALKFPFPYTVHHSWGSSGIWGAEFGCYYDLKSGLYRNNFYFKDMDEAMENEIQRHHEPTIPRVKEIGRDDHGHPLLGVSWSSESHRTIEVYAKMIEPGQRREMSEQELKTLGIAKEDISGGDEAISRGK